MTGGRRRVLTRKAGSKTGLPDKGVMKQPTTEDSGASTSDPGRTLLWIGLTYFLVLGLVQAASLYPGGRVWGFNWLAYFPGMVRWGMLIFAGGLGAIVIWLYRANRDGSDKGHETNTLNNTGYYVFAGCTILVYSILFIVIRARAHFLGDGYGLLGLLGDDSPIMLQVREMGESLFHIWAKGLFSTAGEDAALLSYQIVSIASGVVMVTVVLFYGARLFNTWHKRVPFVFGLLSGGYMLMYFGYVENYSLLAVSVMAFVLHGLLIARGKVRRLTILPFFLVAVFMHFEGLVLVPATIYILTAGTCLGKSLGKLKAKTTIYLGIVLLAALIVPAVYLYYTSYAIRFALVPPVADRFTAGGYTLMSADHLLDFVNLLFVLFPGILIPAIVIFHSRTSFREKRSEVLFLLVLLASSSLAAFVIDPKLGMPRDWDLFTFLGIALTTTGYYLMLTRCTTRTLYATASTLAIALSLMILIPRAGAQATPEIAVRHFRQYTRTDPAKNRYAAPILKSFYLDRGDSTAAKQVSEEWRQRFPETLLLHEAQRLLDEGRVAEAIDTNLAILDIAPNFWNAYLCLSRCLADENDFDSAVVLLEIARGMVPYSPIIMTDMGYYYFRLGHFRKAESLWKKALHNGPHLTQPPQMLLSLYKRQGNMDAYKETLLKAGESPHADAALLQQLGRLYMAKGQVRDAVGAFRRAIDKGLDDEAVNAVISRYPQLEPYLTPEDTTARVPF